MREVYKLWKEKFAETLLETHDSKYHKEDVLAHTLMVFNEALLNSCDFYAITALLHDVGKPLAVTFKEDRKMFPGHEGLSTYLSVNFLKKLIDMDKIDFDDAENILFLINAHGNLMKYKDSKRHWNLYRYETEKLEWIKEFNKFDIKGRITDSETPSLDVYCEPKNQTFDLEKPIVYFTIGVPNSGKTTYIKNFLNDLDVISRDNILMEYATDKYGKGTYSELWKKLNDEDQKIIDKLLNEKIKKLQDDKKNFVIDMTLVSYKSRRKMLNKIRNNYNIIYKNFLVDYDTIMNRNKKRFEEEGKFIPENVILSMMKNYQFPLLGEDDRIVKIDNLIF